MNNQNNKTAAHPQHPFKLKTLGQQIAWATICGAAYISSAAFAQDGAQADDSAQSEKTVEEIIVVGQRASILSAQEIKRDAEQIVDSIVADDIGKLPDRSVTETLQRVPGVTIERFLDIGDPEHFSAEGSGVAIRGMKHVRSELNGRDTFGAAGGRSLSFEDVPSELMAAVNVYKNPSADMIEGGLGGTVDLRTKMPFDTQGQKISLSASANYGDFIEETRPSVSGLYSNRWDTNAGELGVLVDLAYSEIATRTDGIFNRAFFARTDLEDNTVWIPRGADWRSMEFERDRTGGYVALQWRPNDDSEAYFTAFRSEYDMQWAEDAMFVSNNPWDLTPVDATYDQNGVFLSGRLTDTVNDGIAFGADVRLSTRTSVTTDFAGGYKWFNGPWELNMDFQYIESATDTQDLTVATGINLPYLDLNVSGDVPTINADSDYLADPSNYYWAFTMPHIEDSEATQLAWRADAQYSFDFDHIKSVKFGVRLTEREADNINTGYNWQGIYQTWMMGWALDPELGIPRIQNSENLSLNTFNNFYRGDSPTPGVVWAPNVNIAEGYPQSFFDLHEQAYNDAIAAGHSGYGAANTHPYPFRDPNDPEWNNVQKEHTYSTYALMRFAFDNLALPLDGNIGVRLVRTEATASGYLNYPDEEYFDPFYGTEGADLVPISAENNYTNILPSLNLRASITEKLVWRAALSQAIARPGFDEMQAYQLLEADLPDGVTPDPESPPQAEDYILTSSSWSNPNLKPLKADQFDTSLEWYFNDQGGMVHLNLFAKEIEGIIRNQTISEVHGGYEYAVTRPINAGSARITGAEIGYSQFFDFLPYPFNGFGIQSTFTYIDSSTKIPAAVDPDNPDAQIAPVDTDGTAFAETLPYEGLSEKAFNFVAMYEQGPISARLAWSWRSEYLMAIGPNGYEDSNGGINENQDIHYRLPVWSDDTGQLDGSIFYNITDNWSVGLEVNNISNEETRTIMRQRQAGDRYASHFVNDTRYALTVRADF